MTYSRPEMVGAEHCTAAFTISCLSSQNLALSNLIPSILG